MVTVLIYPNHLKTLALILASSLGGLRIERILMVNAEKIAKRHQFKLTPLRKSILDIFIEAKLPLKAYDVLTQLKKIHLAAEPPTVYRVLDYFIERHVIHRIESSHAYILCHYISDLLDTHANEKHIIMLCESCKSSQELSDPVMQSLVNKISADNHFKVKSNLIELSGLCRNCQSN
jgi:Fur family zinc uptake transcriptional regulator